jgi:hypothetical protein
MNCQMFSWLLSSGARGGSGRSEILLGTFSRLLKNAHFVFARDGGNWLNFEEAVVEQA